MCSRKSFSTQPIETAPAAWPFSFTAKRAPGCRGDECWAPTSTASALASPASSHARKLSSTSFMRAMIAARSSASKSKSMSPRFIFRPESANL